MGLRTAWLYGVTASARWYPPPRKDNVCLPRHESCYVGCGTDSWRVPDTARTTPMIEARDLTKRYGDKTAVDHLSFTVEPGKVTGFLGPNGAGKSTTMRLILGLDSPQDGHRDHRRPALPRPSPPAADRRRAAGGQVHPLGPQRPQPPAVPRPDSGPAVRPASMRSLAWSGCATSPASGPAGSRSA